ncbi:MAG: DUF3419 family protein [Deinococcus sp.]|nr:DUF3419 family protein [Deinococcus sp.]
MSEILSRASFEQVRYAQVWEDADVLLAALDVQPGDTVLSICSAGDNALALLTTDAARVVALDLSAAQLHCLALRVAAFQVLSHAELLELVGSRPSTRREELYRHCRTQLTPQARDFWDARLPAVRRGIGSGQVGKFERYFDLFRRFVLPLMLPRRDVETLLRDQSPAQREAFYRQRVNTWRWHWPFRVFFSRTLMGRLGRDPEFFKYVEGDVAAGIQRRVTHALSVLDPSRNPYLTWILTGQHGEHLPLYLRPEHFETIRSRLGRLEWHQQSVEAFLEAAPERSISRFNLSDIFEYMSEGATQTLLAHLARDGQPGGRLVYWNMLAPRSRGPQLAPLLRPLEAEAQALHAQDKAFFYSRLVIEEVLAGQDTGEVQGA